MQCEKICLLLVYSGGAIVCVLLSHAILKGQKRRDVL